MDELSFAWWNLKDFAHYDLQKTASKRRPKQIEDYEAKRDRILDVCKILSKSGCPDLLAVCEITRTAAKDLVSRLPSSFDVVISPEDSPQGDFQVAIFYRKGIGIAPQLPLIATEKEDVPRGTRPMQVVHLKRPGHVIRFVACHWPGLNEQSSKHNREVLANYLRGEIYDFLHPEAPDPGVTNHVVILGDLNEEPCSKLFQTKLIGQRDRKSSIRSYHKLHWTDKDVRRDRLYNLAWRYLGEQFPHGAGRPVRHGPAGTYFHPEKGWTVFDHVLVSGGLLGESPPFVDEENTQIKAVEVLLNDQGLPSPFEPGCSSGVSDHLPIIGKLILPGASQ